MAAKPHKAILPLLLVTAVTAGLLVLDLLSGDSGFGPADGVLLRQIRLPRVLTALLVGAALGLGGAEMQAVFRNPLADPHIMGISAGAGLGAAVAVLAIPSAALGIPAGAVLGALLTSLVVIAAAGKTRSTATLLLLGIMLGFILSAVSATLQYTADEESLKRFYSWAAGSFVGNGTQELWVLTVSLGIAAPHVARWIGRSSSARSVLPLGALCGAAIALLADIISFLGPVPLPVGSTMALVGIPVILYILLKK